MRPMQLFLHKNLPFCNLHCSLYTEAACIYMYNDSNYFSSSMVLTVNSSQQTSLYIYINTNLTKMLRVFKLYERLCYKIFKNLTATSCNTIRPPRLFWYFIIFSACSLSSSDDFLKNLENPGRATSSRSK